MSNLTEKDITMKRKITACDWHQADIIAALRKSGTTLAAVSRASGLSSSTLANALSRSWPKGEKIIADALKLPPSVIWPSRYFDEQGRLVVKIMRRKKAAEEIEAREKGHFSATAEV
jgi:Ner family transcriptional regulator